jgi:hypothetical protein
MSSICLGYLGWFRILMGVIYKRVRCTDFIIPVGKKYLLSCHPPPILYNEEIQNLSTMYTEISIQSGHAESPRPVKGDCPGWRNPLRF